MTQTLIDGITLQQNEIGYGYMAQREVFTTEVAAYF